MNFYHGFKNLRSLIVSAALSFFTFHSASAVDVPEAIIGLSTLDNTVLVVDGGIGADTGALFKILLNSNPQVKTILLNSGGGLVNVGLQMADLVANRGLSTWIPGDAFCASICSAIYFAGKNRMAEGRLGVHQIAMGIESNLATQMTVSDMVEAMNRYGVDQRVFAVMLRTPPEQMYFLNTEEIVLWEVNRGVVVIAGEQRGMVQTGEPLPDLFPTLKSPEELFGDDQSILKGLQLDQ